MRAPRAPARAAARGRPRAYRSVLRQQRKSEMRERIVKAVVDVILNGGVHAFTMQNVADRAGISLRTVYRHFTTREQLLEGLSDHGDAAVEALGLIPPTNARGIQTLMRPLYEKYFAHIRDEVRASVVASIATGYRSKSHLARIGMVRDILAAGFPNLAQREIEDASALMCALTGSRVWYVIAIELGLAPERGGRVAEWAVRVLLEDLRKQNVAAAKSATALKSPVPKTRRSR